MYKNLAATLVAACFISPFLSPLQLLAAEPSAPATTSVVTKPVKAAFVYVTPVLEAGWTRQHDEGRQAAEKSLGDSVKTTVVANVAEGVDAERVVRDLAQQGHDVIFTTSFGYMEPTLKVAKDFPNVKFESITG